MWISLVPTVPEMWISLVPTVPWLVRPFFSLRGLLAPQFRILEIVNPTHTKRARESQQGYMFVGIINTGARDS
jgi:hypothetical protein